MSVLKALMSAGTLALLHTETNVSAQCSPMALVCWHSFQSEIDSLIWAGAIPEPETLKESTLHLSNTGGVEHHLMTSESVKEQSPKSEQHDMRSTGRKRPTCTQEYHLSLTAASHSNLVRDISMLIMLIIDAHMPTAWCAMFPFIFFPLDAAWLLAMACYGLLSSVKK